MPVAGSTRQPGWWPLAILWSVTLGLLLGCSEAADPLDARALRRQFPEQADAILQGPFAFTLQGASFESSRTVDAPAALSGEPGLHPRFPRDGDGAVRFPLPDGSEVRVRELGASGAGEIAENAVAYARRGGTSFWTALEDGYEEWLLLEPGAVRRDAPVAAWQVDGAALRQRGEAVELADARGALQMRVTAPEAYAAGGRPVATRLVAQGERIELWVEAEGETVLVDPRWQRARSMAEIRYSHTATPLPDGRVLITGGYRVARAGDLHDTAEVFDPASGSWSTQAPMSSARAVHTATQLRDGRVLVVGGDNPEGALASVEVFDPASGSWSTQSPMTTPRQAHTATLLSDGRVLIAGGYGTDDRALASVEVFDPASGSWSTQAPMPTARAFHTATLLPDGRLLVAGGDTGLMEETEALASVEVFDPVSGTWSTESSLSTARAKHTATPLPDGRVLIAGGFDPETIIDSAEIFDPVSASWLPAGRRLTVRYMHSATPLSDGRVLIAGGYGAKPSLGGTVREALDTVELFDPVSGSWLSIKPLFTARGSHTATPLPDGSVLVAGGTAHGGLDSAEVLDPASGAWRSLDPLRTARYEQTTTVLRDGRVLVAGGRDSQSGRQTLLDSAEVFDPTSGEWLAVESMPAARRSHTATRLPDGRVLVAGGAHLEEEPVDGVEVFDPAAEQWQRIAPMITARWYHTATLLSDGRVLVAGGLGPDGALESAEVFDPASEQWLPVAPMITARRDHTATPLSDGRVLVTGGFSAAGAPLESAEVFDPASEQWLPVAPMITARAVHAATPLRDGRVVVSGGYASEGALARAEVFDPASGRWLPLGAMHFARIYHTATLLQDGWVLVSGGLDIASGPLQHHSTEAFDPASGTWVLLEPLLEGRAMHAATLLPDGGVLVTGGLGRSNAVAGVQIFRPMPNGSACSAEVECRSGVCTDGVCCDQRCDAYLCQACSELRGASANGVCTSLHPDYPPFACSPQTGEQLKPCRSVHDCVAGFVCDASGDCVPPPPGGGYVDHGGCRLATPAASRPSASGPLELGLLTLAALSTALRRRRHGARDLP
ncbi:uncharacterized protein SOCEGT47_027460 [Sorangium cellulosum]|uniref:Uncharacterized protein n=1 Tax=Sorangium cellulosum TaxID=56 RepID=A0A4P2PZC1_SORCE|nr:kelch repeat-containing protein [Sorangium cellulosum]AUX22245.1 uncharacterized protein SOCEGT47_027460 [Sorangium cellulosum]